MVYWSIRVQNQIKGGTALLRNWCLPVPRYTMHVLEKHSMYLGNTYLWTQQTCSRSLELENLGPIPTDTDVPKVHGLGRKGEEVSEDATLCYLKHN